MNPLVVSFINYVARITPGLHEARQETIDDWAPDMAPSTIVFSDLGIRVADDFTSVGTAANKAVFRAMEHAFAQEDTELTILVANGMVEGMVERALEVGIWDDIRPMLGRCAGWHANRWISFRTLQLPRIIDNERRGHAFTVRNTSLLQRKAAFHH
jgi:hypothetical protein